MQQPLSLLGSSSSGRSAARLARLVRDQEVGGSNPLAPTRKAREQETATDAADAQGRTGGRHQVVLPVYLLAVHDRCVCASVAVSCYLALRASSSAG